MTPGRGGWSDVTDIGSTEEPANEPDHGPHAAPAGEPPPTPSRGWTRRRTRMAVAAAIVLAFIALGAGGVAAYDSYARREAARDRLQEGIRTLEAADAIVVEVDLVVQAEVTSTLEASANAALGKLPEARSGLQRANALLVEAGKDLEGSESQLASALADAASARADMMVSAEKVLEANAAAASALGSTEGAWKRMLDAERLADQAVTRFNKHTKAGVTESTKLTGEAEAKVREAKGLFSAAATAMPEAGFDRYAAYADAKLKLLALSKQIDALWLKGKVEDSNKRIGPYNDEEKKVVALAKALPPSPARLVADAYAVRTRDPVAEYLEARERAVEADAAARRVGR